MSHVSIPSYFFIKLKNSIYKAYSYIRIPIKWNEIHGISNSDKGTFEANRLGALQAQNILQGMHNQKRKNVNSEIRYPSKIDQFGNKILPLTSGTFVIP